MLCSPCRIALEATFFMPCVNILNIEVSTVGSGRTLLDEVLHFRIDYIEHQLAHAVKDPLGRAYNRTTHLKERVTMMQTWADYLDSLKLV